MQFAKHINSAEYWNHFSTSYSIRLFCDLCKNIPYYELKNINTITINYNLINCAGNNVQHTCPNPIYKFCKRIDCGLLFCRDCYKSHDKNHYEGPLGDRIYQQDEPNHKPVKLMKEPIFIYHFEHQLTNLALLQICAKRLGNIGAEEYSYITLIFESYLRKYTIYLLLINTGSILSMGYLHDCILCNLRDYYEELKNTYSLELAILYNPLHYDINRKVKVINRLLADNLCHLINDASYVSKITLHDYIAISAST
jgi:hypothetical protein